MGENNITNVVEHILAQNGLNVGLHRLKFISALFDYILQTDLSGVGKSLSSLSLQGILMTLMLNMWHSISQRQEI